VFNAGQTRAMTANQGFVGSAHANAPLLSNLSPNITINIHAQGMAGRDIAGAVVNALREQVRLSGPIRGLQFV
jgi:hypothetical protein